MIPNYIQTIFKIGLVYFLSHSSLLAKDFSLTIELGKHSTDNPYGEWSVEKVSAKEKKFHAKIITEDTEDYKYSYLENSTIELIDIPYFKTNFIDHSYYHFYWKKRKNQTYFDSNARKINATISPIPRVILSLKNISKNEVTLLKLQSKNIFQKEDSADFMLQSVKPPPNQKTILTMTYNKSASLNFTKDFKVKSTQRVNIPLYLWVKDGGHGDGTGELTYAIELIYLKQGKQHREILAIFTQSDGEGYVIEL